MSNVQGAAAAKVRRRKAIVEGMIDKIVADEDGLAEIHARRKRRTAGELARLRDAEVAYRAAQVDANNAVGDIIQGVESACAAIDRWDEAASRLVAAPGVVPYLAKISRRRRFGSYLSRRLSKPVRPSHAGSRSKAPAIP